MTDASGSGRADDPLAGLFRSGRTNAVISWLMIAVLTAVFVESLIGPDYPWIVFVGAVGAIVLVPPIVYRDWCVMLPWEVLAVALLPILVRGLFRGDLGIFAQYFSIAGLALILTVELHTFTSLQVTHWFAVVFVVLATLASVVAWSIVRWNVDRTFGTSYLSTNDALMMEFVWASVTGFAAGLLFDVYFRRRDRQLLETIKGVGRQ